MTRPWLMPLSQTQTIAARLASAIPVLTTQRLSLRASRLDDWDVLEPIWTTERARFIDGPYNEEDAWLDFCQAVAGWTLRGAGYWTVTRRADDKVLGFTGLGQETSDPELEFGWLFTLDAQGHGYASEAASAIRDWAFAQGIQTFVSNIDPENARSIALATRLGAQRDVNALGANADTYVYRHTATGGC